MGLTLVVRVVALLVVVEAADEVVEVVEAAVDVVLLLVSPALTEPTRSMRKLSSIEMLEREEIILAVVSE